MGEKERGKGGDKEMKRDREEETDILFTTERGKGGGGERDMERGDKEILGRETEREKH